MIASAPRATLLGRTLGHYYIVEAIGGGGMGEVYLAHDQHLNRAVAVKVLPAGLFTDLAARDRFRKEALILSRLNHPNIATVHDFDTHEGIDFLVTEYVPGVSLAEKLSVGPLPEAEVLDFSIQFIEGMVAAHEKQVIHRDLKPGNLRITPDNRVKILDFGLAIAPAEVRSAASAETASMSEVSGTLDYMAPEQLRGEAIDERADIYSAGAVLYEMATGRVPFGGGLGTIVDRILHQPPLPPSRRNPALSAALEQITLRCLEKHPEYRYQSARDLLADLRRAQVTGTATQRSIAVLYLENLSGRHEDEYFRDGITEDISTELSKIKDFHVFSRSALLPYRDKPVTPSYVGQQLSATHVVEGSLRRDGDRLRITAKLVDVKTGLALWVERYDRQLEDVFAIQDEIAKCVADSLRVVLSDGEKHDIAKVPTADVRAYDFYLRGRHFFHEFRRKGLDFAREMFTRAIDLDPTYARAYAGIADCSAFLYMFWDSLNENLVQAEAASKKALELDPDLAEAHTSCGVTASLRKQYEESQREFAIAIRMNPKLYEPYYFSGRNSYVQGKFEEAVRWFEKATLVLPEDYQAPMLMASALHGLGRKAEGEAAYRRGLAAIEKHLDVHPGDARALYFGANALTQLRDKDRAIQWAERALALEPEEHMVLYNVACVYALLGEADRAIDCLEKSITGGWAQREWMEHDPDLASLHNHPRFMSLMHPIGV